MTFGLHKDQDKAAHRAGELPASAIARSAGIAIFVKTPGVSPVKSRLAESIGERAAVDWYRRAAAAVASVASLACDSNAAAAYWAVAETDGLDAWPDLPTRLQGEGGLGERMARVHSDLVRRHGAALLLGADAPQITAEDLAAALGWLDCKAPRMVLGPARDGGFWLFGANRAVPLSAWTRVRYSTGTTALEFERALEGRGAWLRLRTLDDVDRVQDLAAARIDLEALVHPTPAQSELLRWMRGAPASTA